MRPVPIVFRRCQALSSIALFLTLLWITLLWTQVYHVVHLASPQHPRIMALEQQQQQQQQQQPQPQPQQPQQEATSLLQRRHHHHDKSRIINDADPSMQRTARVATKDAFGACLMMKDDNELFYEWLAYHWQVLPLRFLVVGTDVDSQQDPHLVLHRWRHAGIDLNYVVLNASVFVDRYPPPKPQQTAQQQSSPVNPRLDAHHDFVRRQKGFITTCTEILKKWDVHWTTYIDSDEFVAFNRITVEDEKESKMNTTTVPLVDQRGMLPLANSSATVLDFINDLSHQGRGDALGACYTIPRLRFGALENATCTDDETTTIVQNAIQDYHFQAMSTLRFVQHSLKGDFAASKFGKVMMDLSQIPLETVQNIIPRNIHRPYKDYCGPAGKALASSLWRLNHYLGSWERYASRSNDVRRERGYWESVAQMSHGQPACGEDGVQSWFPRFIQTVGQPKAQYLLGVTDTLLPLE